MSTRDSFQLTERDIELVRLTHELRYASIETLAELSQASYTRIHKRVAKLATRHFLACRTRRPSKHIYTVGSEGISLLIANGYAPKELADKRIRNEELKDIFLPHTMFVTRIHARLITLTRNSPVELLEWDQGPALWDSVTVRNEAGGTVVLPVRPDARFTLKHNGLPEGKSRFNFLPEADRSTMSHERMKEKVRAYAAYFQQQKHTKKYPGMKLFQVPTITETKRRAKELTDTYRGMMHPAWLQWYPVIPFEELTLEALMPGIPSPPLTVSDNQIV